MNKQMDGWMDGWQMSKCTELRCKAEIQSQRGSRSPSLRHKVKGAVIMGMKGVLSPKALQSWEKTGLDTGDRSEPSHR